MNNLFPKGNKLFRCPKGNKLLLSDSNFCFFGPIDLIFALFDGIYLQIDDPEGILEKN